MRDINRIDGYCKRLAEMWKKVPDWRFGQFISNVFSALMSEVGDIFFPEDEKLFTLMEEFFVPKGNSDEQTEQ